VAATKSSRSLGADVSKQSDQPFRLHLDLYSSVATSKRQPHIFMFCFASSQLGEPARIESVESPLLSLRLRPLSQFVLDTGESQDLEIPAFTDFIRPGHGPRPATRSGIAD
jgi:hypothetical protein